VPHPQAQAGASTPDRDGVFEAPAQRPRPDAGKAITIQLQRRAEATVEAILEAAAQILERGDALTTNTIAERAGVSIGTLYQYFDAKETLVAELSRNVRNHLVQSVAHAISRVDGMPLDASLRIILGAALDGEVRRPRLALVLDRLEAELGLGMDDAVVKSHLRDLVSSWLHRLAPLASGHECTMLAEDVQSVVEALTAAAVSRRAVIDEAFIHRTSTTVAAIIESRCALGPFSSRRVA
jgi:AcrR family transcriptional regulator